MPIYDRECYDCNHSWEVIEAVDAPQESLCPRCGGTARRIISASGPNCANQDSAWIRTVTDVVDKSATATAVDREFVRNPTRENYRMWMKSRGLRPLEPGEGPTKPKPPDMGRITRDIWRKDCERNRIEVRL